MSKIELKPCPCCGAMAEMRPAEYPVRPYVFCTMCNTLLGPSEGTEAEAAEAWNRRAGEDALRDENARLREALAALVEACMIADEAGELYESIDGSLLDTARAALEVKE